MQDKPLPDWPDKERCLELIRDYYLYQTEADGFETARRLLRESGLTAPHDPFHIMVKCGIWNKNENITLLRSKIPVEFSEECLNQAAAFSEPDGAGLCSQGRRDFREFPLLTVDGVGTKDFDDALHIERKGDNFLVGIHVSDVSHYLKPGTPLYEEAKERSTSIYFPDAIVPMLPHDLSENLFSLLQNKDRPAVSFLVEISPEGAILSHKIVRSVVNVKRQLTYQEAEKRCEQDGALHDLALLSAKLRKNRIEAGALVIPIPDVVIKIAADDSVSVQLVDTETKMRIMVSEFMVLANSLGAEYLAIRQQPGLFRSQASPQKRLFTTPQDDLYVNFRQRRHLSRGILSTNAKRHSGVGVEQYTTITSPIRRMLDLAMQIQMTEILQQKGPYYSTKDLNILSAELATAATRVNLVRQLRHRYWLLKYLENKINKCLPAFILARNDKRVRIVLTDILLEGELPPNQAVSAKPGDTIMVKIAKVQALDSVLRLEWG
jgi:exoribonuclease-2